MFGFTELDGEARQRIEGSLAGAGLRVEPPLSEVARRNFVKISLRSEAESEVSGDGASALDSTAPGDALGAPGAVKAPLFTRLVGAIRSIPPLRPAPDPASVPQPAGAPSAPSLPADEALVETRLLRRPRLKRLIPILLVLIGVLLLAEAAVTVLWKEPFTAIYTARTQNALASDLDDLQKEEGAQGRIQGRRRIAAYVDQRAVAINRRTGDGEPIGRLKVDRIDLNMVVVQGTGEGPLKKGPAHYTETPLPGTKGNWTVGIAGHRTTYLAPFRNLDKLKRGDEVVVTLPYGRFTYVYEKTTIVDADNTKVFVPTGYDRLALTACHPLYSDAQRIIVYTRLKRTEPLGAAARGKKKPPAARHDLNF
jgi:sortase A